MKDTFFIKYRKPGQWFWRTIKNVRDDWFIYGRHEDVKIPGENGAPDKVIRVGYDPICRCFLDEDDNLHCIPLDSELLLPAERQAVVTNRLNKEAGVPVMRK